MKYSVKDLTLEEKMKLLVGRDCWRLENANGKLPDVFLSDGPHGLRMHDIQTNETKKATAMPNNVVLANSWNVDLAYLSGATIADDCIEKGADVLLAPGVNIKRTPLCGRNFEYFSEDPYLAGYMAKSFIEGVQSKGVGTSLKHFCLNNREYDRFYQSSEVDERTMREIYLPAFEIAVQAKPWTVMCSYNLVNGVWASENKWILKEILRDEFLFDGVIVSDWCAVHSSFRAVKATLDLEMPYRKGAYEELKEAYEKGLVTEEEIDGRVENILRLMEKTQNADKKITTTREQRHENALKIAQEGIVLLKNEDGILPITGGQVLVSGFYQSMGGGGSAFVQSAYQERPLGEELKERLPQGNVIIPLTQAGENGYVHNLRATYTAARNADTVVICVSTGRGVESEGYDRTTLKLLPSQEDLIIQTAKVNKNVVVVLSAGSAVDMSAWIDKVKGVVFAGFVGESGTQAIADILTGKVCPSGKLSETFPLSLLDTPTGEKRGNGYYEKYDEGVFVGYRWYDKEEKEVLFPFGYGLSYAKFEYSNLQVQKLGETDYEVSYDIENVSPIDGKEVSQVYVKDVFANVSRPEKELKGFQKTFLKAGEKKRVTHTLNYRSFAYYSVPLKKWYVENGEFEILIGSSSRDIQLSKSVEIYLPEGEQVTK